MPAIAAFAEAAGLRQRILLVDDDPDLRRTACSALVAAGYDVAAVASAGEAKRWMTDCGLPHLAVLDIVMPGQSGLELAAEIHRSSDLPIVFLTATDDPETAARSLEAVAEDYVRKPFHSAELAARIGRVLRRVSSFAYAEAPRVRLAGGVEVDFVGQRAWVRDREVGLTPLESKLLFVLSTNAPRTVPTPHLLRTLWPEGGIFEDSLRVHVHRVRQKLETDPVRPRVVVTVRGLGYRLGEPPDAE